MKEIQSVEVSCLVHSTEDEAKVTRSIVRCLKVSAEPLRESLEGHFGNEVIHLKYNLVGEEAGLVFRSIIEGLERESLQELESNIRSAIDEHSALYLRLGKQELVGGRLVISNDNPVRVRVKPRKYVMRGDTANFYLRHFRQSD